MQNQLISSEVQFQFTHPGRGATDSTKSRILGEMEVSIHAPREGCDLQVLFRLNFSALFQFTHPGRGATFLCHTINYYGVFQFTHPGRGATCPNDKEFSALAFQFTHPGRGATVWCKVAYYGADKQA